VAILVHRGFIRQGIHSKGMRTERKRGKKNEKGEKGGREGKKKQASGDLVVPGKSSWPRQPRRRAQRRRESGKIEREGGKEKKREKKKWGGILKHIHVSLRGHVLYSRQGGEYFLLGPAKKKERRKGKNPRTNGRLLETSLQRWFNTEGLEERKGKGRGNPSQHLPWRPSSKFNPADADGPDFSGVR